jgi:hypothetical protein
MKKVYEVGDKILFSEFAFRNKSGGTGVSNWNWDEKFEGIAYGLITVAWEDDECGWRFHCVPLSQDLIAYVSRNSHDMIVFVSEFDIIAS